MVTAAKLVGADAAKFQTFRAESLVSRGTQKVKYQELITNKNETHFDMIKKLEFSRTPDEFETFVGATRTAENVLGSLVKAIQEEELQMRRISRKSIVDAVSIKSGEIILGDAVTPKRSGIGLSAEYLSIVVGARALRDV